MHPLYQYLLMQIGGMVNKNQQMFVLIADATKSYYLLASCFAVIFDHYVSYLV